MSEIDRQVMKKLMDTKNDINKNLTNEDKNNFYWGIRNNKIKKIFKKLWINDNSAINNTINNKVEISVLSYNINGTKRKISYLQPLLTSHQIIYICETWLIDSDIHFYFNNFSTTHEISHSADMLFPPKQGRPFGGRAFLVNKHLNISKIEFINTNISYISIKFSSITVTVVAAYMPYDNSTQLNIIEFQSCLQLIKNLHDLFISKDHLVLIMGDFNADPKRNNRFDNIFNNFIENNDFNFISDSLNHKQISYNKGDYQACIDHCMISKT